MDENLRMCRFVDEKYLFTNYSTSQGEDVTEIISIDDIKNGKGKWKLLEWQQKYSVKTLHKVIMTERSCKHIIFGKSQILVKSNLSNLSNLLVEKCPFFAKRVEVLHWCDIFEIKVFIYDKRNLNYHNHT